MKPVTDKQKIEALLHAKKRMTKDFEKTGEASGICIYLPNTSGGYYMEAYIGNLLGDYAYVTSWLKPQLGAFSWNDILPDTSYAFQCKQRYLYRLRWIDHMIAQIKGEI